MITNEIFNNMPNRRLNIWNYIKGVNYDRRKY